MDPASATISIVSFGFTVFNRVNEVRKAIKAAPEQLQALQESCLVIDLYLNKLQAAQTLTLSRTTKEMAYLDLLCRRARHHLEQVDHALNNVLVHSSRGGEIKARSLNRFRWFLMKNDLEGISRKVKESQDALGMMLEFMHSNYLRFIAASINDVQCHPLFMSSPPCETAHIVDEDPPHGRSILQCLPNCKCRCHNSSFSHLISSTLTHYLGQILLSKRLLHTLWSSRSLCNVQTCRGDLQQPLQIIWLLPRGFLHVHAYLQTTILMNYPIKLSVVCMRRSISWSAPIWDAITRADLDGVRTFLSTGKTSVWDANPEGWTVFAVSRSLQFNFHGTCSGFYFYYRTYIRYHLSSMRAIDGNATPPKKACKSSVASSKRVQRQYYFSKLNITTHRTTGSSWDFSSAFLPTPVVALGT
ncbi:hypothetical protein BDY19DRAFT_773051 [Irpex rosettiformis]|uniref:Uncharacterized protein n=1 Tax=Irpex rosettiformis TaxID=378272 RepID=A0ACB8U896_9APHY|nr:hypothetical protein BDY19DRAFT_773051 [Irpex rosettiformis]